MTLKEKLLSNFVENKRGCWIWQLAKDKDGYGWLSHKKAHRISWTIFRGEIPTGKCVCHTCDTPSCINPDHLWLGTVAENMTDMYQKGRGHKRGLKGQEHPRAKLTEENISEIFHMRKEGFTVQSIAERFKVQSRHVFRILSKERWSHI